MKRNSSGRRAISVSLVALVVAVLAACTAEAPETTGSDGGTFNGSASEDYYMVTFLSGFPFWKDTYRGFEEAANQLGVTPHYAGTTEYDVNAAISSFEQVIAMNPDGIAVTAMDADAYVDPINRAVDAGIATVTFDSDAPNSKRAAFLGTGNYEAGAEVARELGALFGNESAEVGVVSVLGQTNINDRVSGFTDTLAAEFPNLTLVAVVDAGSDETSASAAAANLLKANPGIDVVFATLVTGQVGTLTAIEEAGMAGQVKVVTFDSDEVTLRNIESGAVEFSIAQGPYHMGYWSMMMLYAMRHDTVAPVDGWREYSIAPLPPFTDTGAFLINGENVHAYLSALG